MLITCRPSAVVTLGLGLREREEISIVAETLLALEFRIYLEHRVNAIVVFVHVYSKKAIDKI